MTRLDRNFKKPDPKVVATAVNFIVGLIGEVGLTDFNKIVKLNREEDDPNICHTHDFCDANMVMLTALAKTFGVLEENVDTADEGVINHMNEAWDYAKLKMERDILIVNR